MFLPAEQNKVSRCLERRRKFMRTYIFVKLEFFYFLWGKDLRHSGR